MKNEEASFFRWCNGIILAAVIVLSSCTSSRILTSEKLQGLKDSYCVPSVLFDYSSMLPPIANVDTGVRNDSALAANFSKHDILMSNALGIIPKLSDFFRLQHDTSVGGKLETVRIRQKILQEVTLASIGIQSLAAELDCEGERIDQVASYLDNINNKKNRTYIVASVITGALTTVATSVISGNINVGIAIGGGLLSAGFGALTINPSGKEILFLHEKNLLQDIWSDSLFANHYPPYIWYVLQESRFSNSGKITIRESIRDRWLQFEFDNKNDGDKQKLLFGKGGLYNSENLHIRAALINQLQATIHSIHQDMASLTLALNKIF